MGTEIDFGYQLGAVQTWGAFERRLAWVTVIAYLLKPTEPEERHRVQHVFLAAGRKKFQDEAKADERRNEILNKISSAIANDMSRIADSKAPRSYLKRLRLDLDEERPSDQSGSLIGAVLGAGLVVRTMYDHRGGKMGPEGAKGEIVARYRTNSLFGANETALKDAWTLNRPIAPLATALLQHISDRKLRKFRTGERGKWRSDIVTYLQHAVFFQDFLLGLKKNAPQLRFSTDDVMTMPAWLGLEALSPNGELWLPPEAVKQTADSLHN